VDKQDVGTGEESCDVIKDLEVVLDNVFFLAGHGKTYHKYVVQGPSEYPLCIC